MSRAGMCSLLCCVRRGDAMTQCELNEEQMGLTPYQVSPTEMRGPAGP